MLDYRELPPLSVDFIAAVPDTGVTCDSCGTEGPTYRVHVPALCVQCLTEHLWPVGTQASRNTNDMQQFVQQSPVGFKWDYLTQSHIPTHPWRHSRRPEPPLTEYVSGLTFRDPLPPIRREVWDTPAFHDPLTPKEPPPGYHWNENLRAYMPDANPSGYRPTEKPVFGSHPREVHDYIVRNYSPTDVRMRYSEIKDEIIYGPRPSVVIQAESVIENNLTAPEKPAILEDKKAQQPDPEENDVAVVLSRSEAEAAYKHAAQALAEIERLEKKYSEDLPNGSVIAFRLTFPGDSTHFSYAAIKAVGQWFATGKIHQSHPAGIGVDWSVLLECFESYGATQFEILRTGGETAELLSGTDQRTVALHRDAPLTAFDAQDEHAGAIRGAVINLDEEADDEEPSPGLR